MYTFLVNRAKINTSDEYRVGFLSSWVCIRDKAIDIGYTYIYTSRELIMRNR